MIWYDDLYLSENIEKKADKIKWKITHNAGMLHMYVISLPQNNDSLLEIISTKELMQRYYPWNPACDLACISAIDRISSNLLPGRG